MRLSSNSAARGKNSAQVFDRWVGLVHAMLRGRDDASPFHSQIKRRAIQGGAVHLLAKDAADRLYREETF